VRVLCRKRQLHVARAGGRPPDPTRARGLKMLTLNSSILVAAPRWRRLCVAVSLGTGTSADGQLSGARHPAPTAFWLFVQQSSQKGHRVFAGGVS